MLTTIPPHYVRSHIEAIASPASKEDPRNRNLIYVKASLAIGSARKNKMRILIAHNRYQQKGGEDVVFDLESKTLEDAGHDVERFVLDNKSIQSGYDKARAAINVSNNKSSVELFQSKLN